MYPIYIISKGRPGNVMSTGTTGKLAQFHIPHYIMVEKSEVETYNKYKNDYATILCIEDTYVENKNIYLNNLPPFPVSISEEETNKFKEELNSADHSNIRKILDHARWCDWSKREPDREKELGAPMGFGAVASRNATKLHAKSIGAKAFYNMDDNATGFFKWVSEEEIKFYMGAKSRHDYYLLQQDETVPVEERSFNKNFEKWGFAKASMSRFKSGQDDEVVKKIFFDDFEPNLFKIDNMGFIGYNTVDACPRCVAQYLIRPMGRRVYSCTLMRTDYPYEWWGQTSDDVLLNIDCLSHGYWMACLWRWVMGKPMTQTTKGGCTTDAYGHKVEEKLKTKQEMMNDPTYALSTYPKTKFITQMYPQYLHTKAWKHRIHHEFLWDLIPNPKVEINLKEEKLEAKSSIDHLFPYLAEEYKKAVKTKAELCKAPPKPKFGKHSGLGFNLKFDEPETIIEDGDEYEVYDENFQ